MLLEGDNLKVLQRTLLGMLEDIDSVCDRENIRYYLIAGTLLGAVRHKDFIPWDDDLDIALPREDYDRFVENAPQWLGDRYHFQNYISDKNYFIPASKVRLNGSVFKEKALANLDIHHGVFIDIFPMDSVSENRVMRRLDSALYMLLFAGLMAKSGHSPYYTAQSPCEKWLFGAIRLFSKLIPRRVIVFCTEKLMRRHNKSNSEVCGFCWQRLDWLFRWDNFGKGRRIPFAGKMFCAPQNPEECLRNQYGDYMRLPPEEERVPGHEVVEFSL